MENMVANEEMVVENVVEEIVETTKPKLSAGKVVLIATGLGALVLGGIALFKKLKKGKKAKEEVKEVETKDEDWTERLDKTIAEGNSIEDLDE